MNRLDRPRGTCPTCGRDSLPLTLIANGVVGWHANQTPDGYTWGMCTGSGQPPAGDWSESMSDTVLADAGRAIQHNTIAAALGVDTAKETGQ